jgi:4-amino-4-deoxy-L-arabinose transferase-like glycosyltransferase
MDGTFPSKWACAGRTRVSLISCWQVAQRAGGLLLLLLAAGLLYFDRLGTPLLQPEDAFYAEIPREMALAGNWVVPLYRGQPYFQKPPLFFWLIRVAYASFGVHDWAARLIPCAAAVATILVTFWWGRRTVGFRAGLAGAFILCLAPRFLHQGRMITMDGLLGFCIILALALGQQAMQTNRLQWMPWLLSAAACGLGLLTKGPATLVLVVMPLLAYQVMDRRTPRLQGRSWAAYLAIALFLPLPWLGAMAWRYPDFVQEFFWTHHIVMRFLQPMHPEPTWFYVPVLFLGMLPGTLLVPALVKLLMRRSGPRRRRRPAVLGFWLGCCLWCLVFYSVAGCKRMGYIVPAMPPLALALGYTLDQTLPRFPFRIPSWRRSASIIALPYWATQGVLVVGLISAVGATVARLVTPIQGAVMAMFVIAGIAWLLSQKHRLTSGASWLSCGLTTFSLLLLTIHLILPGYYRKFSLREQVRSVRDASAAIPVVCYPHAWDSILFYLGRRDVAIYGPDERVRLIADLQSAPETLVFVKSGAALEDLQRCLPSSIEFVPSSCGEIATAGIVRARDSANASLP